MAFHYQTAPLLIGEHEWRIVIRDSELIDGERTLDYQFRPQVSGLEEDWRGQSWFPLPLPSELAQLFEAHRLELTQELQPSANPRLPGF